MKRLALGSILVSVGAYAACAVDEATPPDQNTGGTGVATGGTAGDTGGASGTGQGGTTGGTGAAPTGGTGAAPTGGTGAAPTGGTGGDGTVTGGSGGAGAAPTGGTGGDGTTTGGAGGMGLGGMGLGGMGLGGMGLGGMGLGGMLMGGSGGKGGTGGSGGTAGEDLSKVASVLHGHTIMMPCQTDTSTRVCTPRQDTTRPCTGTGPSYAGQHSWNEQVTLGGTPGVRYLVTLRIRGLVEGKSYTGGADRSNAGTQIPADGLYTGGQANNGNDAYNIYFVRTDAPAQMYFLNSVATSSDPRVGKHNAYELDYQFDIAVDGGSTVCLVSADPNNSAIKNCAEPDNASVCNPKTLANLDPLTATDVGTQPYNGQFVGLTVLNTRRM